MLSHEFPRWPTVYSQVRRWRIDGVWPALHDRIRDEVLLAEVQTVKAGDHTGNAGMTPEKIIGRKRHLRGQTLAVVVTAAKVQGREGAKAVLLTVRGQMP